MSAQRLRTFTKVGFDHKNWFFGQIRHKKIISLTPRNWFLALQRPKHELDCKISTFCPILDVPDSKFPARTPKWCHWRRQFSWRFDSSHPQVRGVTWKCRFRRRKCENGQKQPFWRVLCPWEAKKWISSPKRSLQAFQTPFPAMFSPSNPKGKSAIFFSRATRGRCLYMHAWFSMGRCNT